MLPKYTPPKYSPTPSSELHAWGTCPHGYRTHDSFQEPDIPVPSLVVGALHNQVHMDDLIVDDLMILLYLIVTGLTKQCSVTMPTNCRQYIKIITITVAESVCNTSAAREMKGLMRKSYPIALRFIKPYLHAKTKVYHCGVTATM